MASGKHAEITDLIIKAFYVVYNTLGYGFAEKVYQNALAVELRAMGLAVEVEYPITVYYKGQSVGLFSADLFVAGCVIVELKAIKELIAENEAQLLNYLRSTIYEVGLLLNCGPEPQIKRKSYDNMRKGAMSWLKP